MSGQPPKRVPENAPGDFYVEDSCCLRCCLPHGAAPDLMNDEDVEFEQCFFRRQPRTAAEIEQAIRAISVSCIQALRYGGSDPAIIRRLHESGCGDCCDRKIHDS